MSADAEARVDAMIAEMDAQVGSAALERRREQHGPQSEFIVYRLFDHDLDLVYVGATGDFAARMSGHAGEQCWWVDVDIAVIVTDGFVTEADAAAFEGLLIAERQPKFNKLGVGGRRYRSFDTAARSRAIG